MSGSSNSRLRSAWAVPPIFVGGVEAAVGLLERYAFAPATEPDVISCQDLVAVAMLGVSVPAQVALRLLEADAARVTALLRAIPQDMDLADAPPELLDPQGAPRQLWNLVDASHGRGAALTSRLMARKRPQLVPVQDDLVQAAVGYRTGQDFWAELQALLVDDDRRLLGRSSAAVRSDRRCLRPRTGRPRSGSDRAGRAPLR